jgi:hypothetical protein
VLSLFCIFVYFVYLYICILCIFVYFVYKEPEQALNRLGALALFNKALFFQIFSTLALFSRTYKLFEFVENGYGAVYVYGDG